MSFSQDVVRKLWHVESFAAREGDGYVDVATLETPRAARGVATEEECRQVISPSFIGIVKSLLPLPSSHPHCGSCGGDWFWEVYRHGLSGENVIVHLGGTCSSLSTDTLDSQKTSREKIIEWIADTTAGSARGLFPALAHSSSKLEVMLAMAMSVALHVAQQPLLEANEGPQAVVLCATKDQCDEFTFLLDKFCGELHLLTHNLFAPYPSIPSTKRADIVVGTAPLWESASSLDGSNSDYSRTGGMESIISQVSGDPVAPTFAKTKWRPYSSRRVSQLVLFDVELQFGCGFGPMLRRWSACDAGEGGAGVGRGADHAPWQFYVVCEQGSGGLSGGGLEQDGEPELSSLLASVESLGKESGYGAATVFSPRRESRKRGRSADSDGDAVGPRRDDALPLGLIVKRAISFARFLTDPGSFADFKSGILEQCGAFWGSFDGVRSLNEAAMSQHVEVRLVFLCRGAGKAADEAVDPSSRNTQLKEVAVLVRPTALALQEKRSRAALLMQYLAEKLTGTIFDGNAIACMDVGEGNPLSRRFALLPDANPHPFLCVPPVAATSPLVAYEGEGATSPSSNGAESAALELTEARLKAFENAFSTMAATATTNAWPVYATILEEVAPLDPFTVLVLRNVSSTVDEMCRNPTQTNATFALDHPVKKPFVQYVLEECCQYGRVISYFGYQYTTGTPRSPHASSSASGDDDDSGGHHGGAASGTTAALFVEFQSASSALEATKMFAQRFSLSADVGTGHPRPRAHMMRNATFYAGVAQETQPTSDEDSLFGESLLAE